MEAPAKKHRRERDQWVREKEELEGDTRRLLLQLDEQAKLRELDHQLWVLSIRGEEHLKQQISALEAQVKSRDNAIRLLKDKLKGSQDLLNEHSESIKRLGQELRDSRSQCYAQEEKIEDLEMRCLELGADLRGKTTQVDKLLASQNLSGSALAKQLQNQIESQAQTIKELSVKADSQEDKIQKAQEAAFQLQKKARRDTMDDSEIRVLLQNEFMEMTKEWAKEWSVPELNTNDAAYKSEILRKEFEKVGHGSQLKGVSPRIVLTALLSNFISERIFQQPFPQLFSDGPSASGKSRPQMTATNFSEIMNRLYAGFLKIDDTEAHAWRSQIIQLLDKLQTSDPSLFPGSGSPPEWLTTSRTQHLAALATSFTNGPASGLLRPLSATDTKQRTQDLVALLTTSSQLSSNLWKQRAFPTIRSFSYFEKIPFRNDSREMEPHRIHKLEKGDQSKDGEKVGLVVLPGFVAFGNEEGEGYSKDKVWAKAVVVLA
ncbi:MAG: hypothetical protein M1839_008543 [Geoglossum umbratile]|nr:MAG: hypothetical protein M1839_008543 [Geoglossum umbratile]